MTTTGALFEATRGSPHAELYAQIAGEGLDGRTDLEEARADLAGVLRKLELSVGRGANIRRLVEQGRQDEPKTTARLGCVSAGAWLN